MLNGAPWRLPLLAALVVAGAVLAVRAVAPPPSAAAPPTVQSKAPDAPLPGAGATPLELVAEDGATRTLRHVQGTSVVPRHPLRVAVLGWNDEVAALGVVPVAAGGDGRRGFAEHLRPLLAGARLIDTSGGGPDLEALAAAKPDVIVAAWLWQTSYAALSRIAPTVVLQSAHWEWRERFRDIALVLDRQAEGEARLARLDAHLGAAREAIRARIGDESVALVRVFAREYRLYGRGFSGPILYQDLGLTPPALIRELAWKRDMVQLSIEGLCRLDADHLLLMTEDEIPVSMQVRERLADHPLWRRLRAVRDGHVHEVPNILMRGGIIARELMADRMRELLAP